MPRPPPLMRQKAFESTSKANTSSKKPASKMPSYKKPGTTKRVSRVSKPKTESPPITQAQIKAMNAFLNGPNAYRNHLKSQMKRK
tara:strand:+ start:438 stop:692 length:255 start_codon:yes stop_codon:yes gene_type:complete